MEMSITVVVMKMVSYFPLFFMYILLHPSHLDKSSRNFTYQLSVDCLLKWAKFKDFALYTAKSITQRTRIQETQTSVPLVSRS